MHDPVQSVGRKVWRGDGVAAGPRAIPEETAIALTYNGGTYAVMMGTPKDLGDFAVGFSLSEGIVQSADEIEQLDGGDLDDGIDSLAEAVRPAAIVRHRHAFSPQQIMTAMQAIASLQKINVETRAVHAAAFWTQAQGIIALREDVGRHNALDKLAGALALQHLTTAG